MSCTCAEGFTVQTGQHLGVALAAGHGLKHVQGGSTGYVAVRLLVRRP